jgi:hypothetical protein
VALSSIDRYALSRGRPVVKMPKGEDAKAVEIHGVIRVEVPTCFLVRRLSDIETFMLTTGLAEQAGRFDALPGGAAVPGLELPRDDIGLLEKCSPGHCKFKLPADAIGRLRTDVSWSEAGGDNDAAALVSSELARYLDLYRAGGESALPAYGDKPEPHTAAEGFRHIRERSERPLAGDPELDRYLRDYPHAELLPGGEDVFLWTVEDFGLRPVTGLSHVVIHRREDGSGPPLTFALKQIYSSHYFQSAIKFGTIKPISRARPQRGALLTLSAAIRLDTEVGGFMRFQLNRDLEHHWLKQLRHVRDRMEESYRELILASTSERVPGRLASGVCPAAAGPRPAVAGQ